MSQHKLRKACDFCYRRRVKCDAKQPRCSNCILHDSECSFRAASRKAQKRQKRKSEDTGPLQLQVESLESSLDQALKRIEELQNEKRKSSGSSDHTADMPVEISNVVSESLYQVDFDEGTIPDQARAGLPLPSLEKVLSATEVYITTFNAILPLFHSGRLLQLIHTWYTYPDRRERTTWAAINVVLALAYRQTPPNQAMKNESAAYYLHNVQSVLSDVIMGGANLLNVQTVIGMVLLLQGTHDLKPATMLIAIALRLAHELGLHTRKTDEGSTSHLLEQQRVFWIAYILDKDISMRTNQPPIQREADIELKWPSVEPEDGAGNVIRHGSDKSFNFLRCRVQLAQIQGEVYDFMTAIRVETIDEHQRSENTIRLNQMLDEWMLSIPLPFRPSILQQSQEPNLSRSFVILYSTYLNCRNQVYRAHVMSSRWMQSLRLFGRAITQQRYFLPAPVPTSSLLDWEKLVVETRSYMRLFREVEPRDQAFICMTACTYISGSVCLMANVMFQPYNENVEHDLSLADLSIALLNDLIRQTGDKSLMETRSACKELLHYACALSPKTNAFDMQVLDDLNT